MNYIINHYLFSVQTEKKKNILKNLTFSVGSNQGNVESVH